MGVRPQGLSSQLLRDPPHPTRFQSALPWRSDPRGLRRCRAEGHPAALRAGETSQGRAGQDFPKNSEWPAGFATGFSVQTPSRLHSVPVPTGACSVSFAWPACGGHKDTEGSDVISKAPGLRLRPNLQDSLGPEPSGSRWRGSDPGKPRGWGMRGTRDKVPPRDRLSWREPASLMGEGLPHAGGNSGSLSPKRNIPLPRSGSS